MDDDPSEVDWLKIEDESEQASRLAGKKLLAAPMKKRGQTTLGTSASEKPREVIDPKEAEDPASKCRRIIVDWPEDEDEEVAEIPKPAAAVRSDVAKSVPTTGAVAKKGARPEKTKKSLFATVFHAIDL
jgi:hypothetical protein